MADQLTPAQRDHMANMLSGSQGLKLRRLLVPILHRKVAKLHRLRKVREEKIRFAYPATSHYVLDYLRDNSKLAFFGEALLCDLMSVAQFKCFEPGSEIVMGGEPASITGIVVIVAGEAVVTGDGSHFGHNPSFQRLFALSVLGDDRIFTDAPAPCPVLAVSLVSAYFVPYVAVMAKLGTLPPQAARRLRAEFVPPRVDVVRQHFPQSVASMKKCWICQPMSDKDIATLIGKLSAESYFPGDEIIVQGDVSPYMYFLRRGAVNVIINGHTVASLKPPVSFGEMALIFHEERNATVVATAACDVWALCESDFRAFLSANPQYDQLVYDTAVKLRMQRLSMGLTSAAATVARILGGLRMLRGAGPTIGDDLFRVAKPVVIPSHRSVASTSEFCKSLIVVARGTAVSQRSDARHRYGPGSVLGEHCLVAHRWPLAVCSLTMIDAWEIPVHDLTAVLKSHGILASAIEWTKEILDEDLAKLGCDWSLLASTHPLTETALRQHQELDHGPKCHNVSTGNPHYDSQDRSMHHLGPHPHLDHKPRHHHGSSSAHHPTHTHGYHRATGNHRRAHHHAEHVSGHPTPPDTPPHDLQLQHGTSHHQHHRGHGAHHGHHRRLSHAHHSAVCIDTAPAHSKVSPPPPRAPLDRCPSLRTAMPHRHTDEHTEDDPQHFSDVVRDALGAQGHHQKTEAFADFHSVSTRSTPSDSEMVPRTVKAHSRRPIGHVKFSPPPEAPHGDGVRIDLCLDDIRLESSAAFSQSDLGSPELTPREPSIASTQESSSRRGIALGMFRPASLFSPTSAEAPKGGDRRHSYAPPAAATSAKALSMSMSSQEDAHRAQSLKASRSNIAFSTEDPGVLQTILATGREDIAMLEAVEADEGHTPKDFLAEALFEEALASTDDGSRFTSRAATPSVSTTMEASLSRQSSMASVSSRVEVVVGSASLGGRSKPFARKSTSNVYSPPESASPSPRRSAVLSPQPPRTQEPMRFDRSVANSAPHSTTSTAPVRPPSPVDVETPPGSDSEQESPRINLVQTTKPKLHQRGAEQASPAKQPSPPAETKPRYQQASPPKPTALEVDRARTHLAKAGLVVPGATALPVVPTPTAHRRVWRGIVVGSDGKAVGTRKPPSLNKLVGGAKSFSAPRNQPNAPPLRRTTSES